MERYLTNGAMLNLKGIDGHYIIKNIIGRGSSCVVYSADFYNNNGEKTEHLLKEFNPRCLDLERVDDILIPTRSEDQEIFNSLIESFKEGFDLQSELRSLPELKNYTANIQNIYHDKGTVYIDMTETNGNPYSETEEESILNLAQRIKVLAQVIGYYHKNGYLHLDIKPGNVFVRPKKETCQDVLLFDFDSLIPFREGNGKCIIDRNVSVSYTAEYAPIELISSIRRDRIGKATDIYEIGEIFFEKLMRRHSTALEHNPWSSYDYPRSAGIFTNANPKVYPLLDELFQKTLCNNASMRYQSTDDLIICLDKIIELSNPKEPFLKSSLPDVSGFFTGRDSEIEEIHKRLQENNVLFLSGIGGIGKSELAKHYAKAHKDSYDAIIFASFLHDIQTMMTNDSYVQIHNFACEAEEKPNEYFERKMRELAKLCNERTLIIVDNFDTTEDENLSRLLSLNCKMLVTTRMDFSDVYPDSQINIVELSNPFDIFREHYKKPLTEEEQKCVEKIIEIVCGHTMTVELLAKQMMAGRVKPEKMLEKLKDGGISESGKEKVFHTDEKGDISRENTYDHIQALFDLSDLDEDEKYILANLSLIPHTGIPAELFKEWCEIEDFSTINNLAIEGWIRWDKEKDYISLHPVVSDLSGDELHRNQALLSNFSTYISDESSDYFSHVFGQQMRGLILTLTYKFAVRLLKPDAKLSYIADVLYKIGGVFYDYSDYVNCEKVWLKVSAEYNNRSNIKDIAEIKCSLALLYAEMGRIEKDENMILKSIESYQSSIPIFKKLNDWTSIATAYNNMGAAYHDLKKYEVAISMYQHSLECHEHQSTKDSKYISHVAICHNNIGMLYKDMQLYRQSTESYQKALFLLRKQPWNTIDNALIRHNLAVVLYKKDSETYDLQQAKTYVEEALSIRQDIFPVGNISIAQSEELLARILMEFNTESYNIQAEQLLISAQKPFSDYYGKDGEDYIRLLKCLTVLQAE